MRRFVLKTLWILSPLLPIAALYFVFDPFCVVREHEVFFNPADSVWVSLNADHVSTCTYDRMYPSQHYDAIIFGNSRSRYYLVEDWKKFLPQGCSPYHFDAHNESLYALMRKVEYIEREGHPIRYALVVIDNKVLEQDKAATPHMNYISPQLEGNTLAARIGFQMAFFKAWFNPKFIFAYFDTRLYHKMRPYMVKDATMMKTYPYDPKTNEEYMANEELRIAAGTYYDEPDIKKAFSRTLHAEEVLSPVIKDSQLQQLQTIRAVFDRLGTDYHIIVSPIYIQERMNPADIRALKDIFGDNRVHDYSGKNNISSDIHNFYEPYHYRPCAALRIMEDIYTGSKAR